MTNEEKILEALSEIKAAILENKREITRTNMRLENEIIPQLHLLAGAQYAHIDPGPQVAGR